MARKNSRNWSVYTNLTNYTWPGKQPKGLLADIIKVRSRGRVGFMVRHTEKLLKYAPNTPNPITFVEDTEWYAGKASNTRTGVAYRKGKRRMLKRQEERLFWRELVQQDMQAEVDQREQTYHEHLAEEVRLEAEYHAERNAVYNLVDSFMDPGCQFDVLAYTDDGVHHIEAAVFTNHGDWFKDMASEQQIAQYKRVSCRQAPRQPIVIEDELFAAHEPEQIVVDIVGLTLARKLAKSGSTYGTVRAA